MFSFLLFVYSQIPSLIELEKKRLEYINTAFEMPHMFYKITKIESDIRTAKNKINELLNEKSTLENEKKLEVEKKNPSIKKLVEIDNRIEEIVELVERYEAYLRELEERYARLYDSKAFGDFASKRKNLMDEILNLTKEVEVKISSIKPQEEKKPSFDFNVYERLLAVSTKTALNYLYSFRDNTLKDFIDSETRRLIGELKGQEYKGRVVSFPKAMTLKEIAGKVYQNENEWKKIYEANKFIVINGYIPANKKIYIP